MDAEDCQVTGDRGRRSGLRVCVCFLLLAAAAVATERVIT